MTPSNTLFVEHFTQAARVAEARPDGTYTVKALMQIAAEAGGIPTGHLSADWRDLKRTRPRQVLCWLARRFTNQSFPQIGRRVCRDHTTVFAAVRHINQVIAQLGVQADANTPEAWAKALLAVNWPHNRTNVGAKRVQEAAVLKVVKANNGGSTPELHAVLKQIMPRLHITTVRSKLNLLEKDGLVYRIETVPYAARWHLSARCQKASLEQNRNSALECPP